MKIKLITASAIIAAGLSAGGTASGQIDQDGLVNVAIEDTNVNVVVPITAAVALAANICDVDLTVAVLSVIDQSGGESRTDCDARSRAFADAGDIVIRNNN